MRASLRPCAWVAALLVSTVACASDVDDLFGGAGGAEGAAGPATTTSSGAPASGSVSASGVGASGSTNTATVASSTGAGAGCGNGVLDAAEACDGADLGGHSCLEAGYASAAGAVCTPACLVDLSGCAAVCGNNAVEPGEACDDGGTVPGDGCSATCAVEGLSCALPIARDVSAGTVLVSGTTGGIDAFASTGCTQGGGATGPELVYALRANESGFLTVWTVREETAFDAVLYLRDQCDSPDTEIVCNDNVSGFNDLVGTHVEQGQTVYLFVDGFLGASGAFQIAIDLSRGNCNDPVPIIAGGAGVRVVGTTAGQGSDHSGTCGGGSGDDVVYEVTRFLQGDLTVAVDATFNSATYARQQCTSNGSEIDCDSPTGSLDSSIFIDNPGDTPFYVIVDTASGGGGKYTASFLP